MAKVKFSSKMESKTWRALQRYSEGAHQTVSGVLSEAVEQYLRRKTVREEVIQHLERSIEENQELGRLLAKPSNS